MSWCCSRELPSLSRVQAIKVAGHYAVYMQPRTRMAASPHSPTSIRSLVIGLGRTGRACRCVATGRRQPHAPRERLAR